MGVLDGTLMDKTITVSFLKQKSIRKIRIQQVELKRISCLDMHDRTTSISLLDVMSFQLRFQLVSKIEPGD